ncbi:MAG: glycine cleavage T C-terminal barrel domain-containing protein, partial [Pseudomonadota bacterium]
SDDWAALALNGPASRSILSLCTDVDLSNAAFPWLTAQELTVAGKRLWGFRMSYAGELGWEFHIPRDDALAVYDAMWRAGADLGIADYGSFAMNVLRMEKAFKGAGELTNEVTLAEADVLRFARRDKDYLGRGRTWNQSSKQWVCAYLQIEPDGINDGHGGEAVLQKGKVIGATASVVFSHTVGKILAFAYLAPAANVPGSEIDVLIAGQPRKGRILADPVYDPDNKRPRADALETVAQ